ncbi:hypothetical protein ACWIGI_30230 [Nocardia sp. NPDC055321]
MTSPEPAGGGRERAAVRTGPRTGVTRACATRGLGWRPPEGRGGPHASLPDSRARHRMLIEAVLPDMAGETVVSHQSAALLYGAPLWRTPLDRVCVTRNRRGGGRTRPLTRVHGSPLHAAVRWHGLLLTPPARTVVDLALSLPFESAVVAGDALVGMFGIGGGELAHELSRAAGRHGIAQAKQVIAFLDGRSGGAGESLSRIMLRRMALPAPRTRGDVVTADGRFVARVGFYYENTGVVCEFDGPIRFGRRVRPGDDVAEVVRREMIRDHHLRALGLRVVRWTWSDLAGSGPAHRLYAALARPGGRRFDGRIDPGTVPEPRRTTLHPL